MLFTSADIYIWWHRFVLLLTSSAFYIHTWKMEDNENICKTQYITPGIDDRRYETKKLDTKGSFLLGPVMEMGYKSVFRCTARKKNCMSILHNLPNVYRGYQLSRQLMWTANKIS